MKPATGDIVLITMHAYENDGNQFPCVALKGSTAEILSMHEFYMYPGAKETITGYKVRFLTITEPDDTCQTSYDDCVPGFITDLDDRFLQVIQRKDQQDQNP